MSKENLYFEFRVNKETDDVSIPLYRQEQNQESESTDTESSLLEINAEITALLEGKVGIDARTDEAKYLKAGNRFIDQPLLSRVFQQMADDLPPVTLPSGDLEKVSWETIATETIKHIIEFRRFSSIPVWYAVNQLEPAALNKAVDQFYSDLKSGRNVKKEMKPYIEQVLQKLPPFFILYVITHATDIKQLFKVEKNLQPKRPSLTAVQTFEYWSILYAAKLRQGHYRYLDDETNLGYSNKPYTEGGTSKGGKLARLYNQLRGTDPRQN